MKLKRLLCFLLAAILLAGCQTPVNQPAESTVPVVNTQPTEETTVPTTLPAVELQAVNKLSFRASKESPEICTVDSRTAVFLTGVYVSGDFSTRNTQVQVLDLYTDTVIAENTFEGAFSILTAQGCGDSFALYNEQTREIRILDRMLQQVHSFETTVFSGVLTPDLASYYYIWGSSLYCMDTASGEGQRVKLDRELSLVEILGFDPTENILLVNTFVNPYTVGTCPGAIDLDTNQIILLRSGPTGGSLTENGACMETYNAGLRNADLIFAQWNGDGMYSLPAFLRNDNDYSTWCIPGTDYIYRLSYDKKEKTSVENAELFRLGETLSVCQLPAPLNTKKINETIVLPDGNLLAVAITSRGYQPYLLCPQQLEFTDVTALTKEQILYVDETVFEEYQQAAVVEDVPEQLRQVRKTADDMETKYGVTILMSNQCTAAAQSSSKEITTTNNAGMGEYESQWIENALTEVDAALALYPEDFFFQFRNDAQERGVLILLVEDIADELNVIGICYQMGDWHIVAIDITSGEVMSTVCHEIWHATENKITTENPQLLSYAQWDACNPDGFMYSYNTTESYIYDKENTLFNYEKDADIYFIDPYAKTKPQEDRARLMEYIMCSKSYARKVASIPALRKKLEILSDAVRQVFDTTDWDVPYWERYF